MNEAPSVVVVCDFQYGPYTTKPAYRRCGKTAIEAIDCKNLYPGCARNLLLGRATPPAVKE